MHILSVNSSHVGGNIKNRQNGAFKVNTTSLKLLSTSDNSADKDQVVWNIGTAMNTASDRSNSDDNKIKIRMKVLVNEVQNLTSGTIFKVGAGVIGLPRMVWIGQLNVTLKIENTRQPKMNFVHTLTNEK